ncbi:hypothetical protein KPP03845_107422 [Streptomyces xanthophaeus]|nr:hypothetical protein KPP03845_107422 [Streptomyces xanthophaeus]
MHIVLDETAMAAAGQGNVLASRLIHRAHAEADGSCTSRRVRSSRLAGPAPGTAEHLTALPGITVLDLDLPAALAVVQQGTWAAAHSQHAGQPTADRPDGAIVATTLPKRWEGQPVGLLDLTP